MTAARTTNNDKNDGEDALQNFSGEENAHEERAMEDCGVGRGCSQDQEVAHTQSLQEAMVMLGRLGAFSYLLLDLSLSCAFLCLVVVAVS